MTAAQGLSIRAYAAHRKALGLPGTSPTSVQKALKDGRIHKNAGGKIDPDTADLEWTRNTDPARGGPRPPAGPRLGAAPPNGDGQAGAGAPTRADARAISEAYRAKMLQLDLEERAGNLVQLAPVERETFAQARRLRDAVLAVPDRIEAELAATSDVRAVSKLLTDALEEALRGLVQDGGQP